MKSSDGHFIRKVSPNISEDGNSESAMTTLPIGERTNYLNNDHGEMHSMSDEVMADEKKNDCNKDIYARGKNFKYHQQILMDGNSFAFWSIVTIMLLLALGNLGLTMTIIGVFSLGKGMEHIELVPETNTIKFFGITDLDRIYKRDGRIDGFENLPVTVTGDNSAVRISLLKPNGHHYNRILMSKNGTTIHGVSHFEVKTQDTAESIFSTHKPHFNIPTGLANVHTKTISSSRITSPIDETLMLNNTRGKIFIRGTEGVRINGKDLLLSVDQNIVLRSENGTIIIEGAEGIFIDLRDIPIVGDHGVKLDNTHFKLCVCMPQGRLFRTPVAPSSNIVKGLCSHYNIESDPCA